MSSGKGSPGGATAASSDKRRLCRLCPADVGEHSDELLNQSLDCGSIIAVRGNNCSTVILIKMWPCN